MSQSKSQLANRESSLEREVVDHLAVGGAIVRRGVRLDAGVADVVAEDLIIELKYRLDQRSLRDAVARLQAYGREINPSARLVVICMEGATPALEREAAAAGVELITWDGSGRGLIRGRTERSSGVN